MIEVILPCAYVLLPTLIGHKFAESISLVVLPVTLVDVSIGAPQLTLPIGLVVKPLTFVFCVVLPDLNTIGAFPALLVHIACVKGILHYFDILDILQVKLTDHLLEL
jgi:hypothetical protein